jgi:parallel beta-helix repeat protein
MSKDWREDQQPNQPTMKTKSLFPRAALLALLLSTLNAQLSTTFAQGSLTPPAAPAPTMKTLAQIEPRTAITTSTTPGDAGALFIISQPGSYYLTTNITGVVAKNGITIAANGVTLDLMGFELAGVAGSSNGVFVSGTHTNIAIRNGAVRSWGRDGVGAGSAYNGQYQDLRLSANGLKGLNCGPNSTVINCTALSNSGDGISAADGSTVSGCTAQSNAGNGISTGLGSIVSGCSTVANTLHGINVGDGCTISGCTARSNGTDGIFTAFDCTVSSCTSRRNDAYGINANTGNTVSECTVNFNGADGIFALSDCQVRHNNCRQNGRLTGNAAGIFTTSSNNRIEDNNVTGNAYGIQCLGAGNIVLRNTASDNTVNYDILAGNRYGPIINITAGGAAGVSGSGTAASTVATTDPWANFSY